MTIGRMCTEWAKTVASGGSDGRRRWQGVRVFWEGDTIYSYGYHFPMARILAPNLVWMNGDRYSVSTSNHQSELRAALSRYAGGAQVLIVPMRAMESAGILLDTLNPVDIQRERFDYTLVERNEPPADMLPLREGTYARFGDGYSDAAYNPDNPVGYVLRDGVSQYVRKVGDTYQWHNVRHWLGDAVFTAKRWTVDHAGNRVMETAHFISSFDRQESRPLYFLSQLPGPADTVEQAIESLAPESVHTARSMGREVVRQGDMFAIPMGTTTRELKALGGVTERRKVVKTLVSAYAIETVQKRDALREAAKGLRDEPKVTVKWGRVDIWAKRRDAAHTAWRAELFKMVEHLDIARDAEHAYTLFTYEPDEHDYRRQVTGTALYGTAHTATEVCTLPDGRQYARGTMYHEPAVIGEVWRERDHARRKLGDGKTWHLVARNTVPVTGVGVGRRN